jgi:hypothetical protein
MTAEHTQERDYNTGHPLRSQVKTPMDFVLDEVAPGFTPQEVMALTEMDVAVGPNIRTMG